MNSRFRAIALSDAASKAGCAGAAYFIRAPAFAEVGKTVTVLATLPEGNQAVAVRQEKILTTCFHPKVSGDDSWLQVPWRAKRTRAGPRDQLTDRPTNRPRATQMHGRTRPARTRTEAGARATARRPSHPPSTSSALSPALSSTSLRRRCTRMPPSPRRGGPTRRPIRRWASRSSTHSPSSSGAASSWTSSTASRRASRRRLARWR